MPDPDEIDLTPLPNYSSAPPNPASPPLHDLALRLRKLAIKPAKAPVKPKAKMKIKRRVRHREVRDVKFY